MAFRTIEVALRANVAQFQAQMGAAGAQVKAFGSDVNSTLTSTDQKTQQSLEKVSRGATLMGAALLAGFGVSVMAAANFDKAMSGVQAVSGATAGEMKLLGEAALKSGADTSFSATEAAQAQAELAKAGISTADILGGALTGSLSLAAAGQLDLKDAAEISAQAMNIFGLSGGDVARIADVLAAGANKSAADVAGLGDSLRQGGLVAAQTGLTLEETVGTLAAFADNALVGEDAGTSLKTMLQRLTPTSKEAAELMAQLGFSAYDAQGNFIGMEALAGELQSSLGGLTVEQRNTAMATLFGSDAVRGANIIYEQGAAGIAGYITAVDDQGAASRMAADLTNNLAGDVERLGGAIETALIRGGTGANSVLREMAQFATGVVNAIGELPTPVAAAATAFAGVSGSILLVIGGIGTLVPKIQSGREALRGLGDAGATADAGLGRVASAAGKLAGIGAVMYGIAEAGDAITDAMAGPPPQIDKVGAALFTLSKNAALGKDELIATSPAFEDMARTIKLAAEGAEVAGGPLGAFFADVLGGDGPADAQKAAEAIEQIDQQLSTLVQSGNADEAARSLQGLIDSWGLSQEQADQLRGKLDAYDGALIAADTEQKRAAESAGGLAGAQGVLAGATGESIAITEAQKVAMEESAKAAEELERVHQSYADAAAGFVDPLRAWTETVDEATTKAREHAEGVAASTADTTDSWEDYVTNASGSLDGFIEKLQNQITAQDEWATNLKTIAARGRIDVVDELTLMGEEGAGLVAALATANGEDMNRGADLIIEAGRRGSLEYGTELDIGMKAAAEIVKQGGNATVQSVMDALGPMPGLTADLIREVGAGMGVSIAESRPAWDQEWGGRATVSLEEMQRVANEAPPKVQQATNTINQWLIDTNPAFAEQFASRRGVSIDEMNTMLRDAPPLVQESARLYNEHLGGQLQGFIDQMAARKIASVGEMQGMLNEAPPIVLSAGQAYVQNLVNTNPAFAQQMADRKNVSVDEMRAMYRDAPPIVGDVAWALVEQLAGRLPPFRSTAEAYTNALSTSIRNVSVATVNASPTLRALTGQADGGIVEFYAQGGMKESHQAQIARAGDWRVWAEPETGGEAYIPLAVAKRDRSTGILEEVASRFGLVVRPAKEDEILDYSRGGFARDSHEGCQHFHSGGLYVPPAPPQFADYGPPIRPAGATSMQSAYEHVKAAAEAHMQEPHHQAPPPGAGGGGGGGGGLSGGNALARVNSILGGYPGARVTSTYRSPSRNAAAGGATNSYHMDRNNPAVDIGGPTGTLDLVAGRLRSMGGWREGPLWRVRGHYDHVHVAEEGMVIDSMQSFDKGGWLQPGMTLAHNGTGAPERVVAMGEGGLRGDTFYGDPGGYAKKQERINDGDGAQFDYMNRRETHARRQQRLDEPFTVAKDDRGKTDGRDKDLVKEMKDLRPVEKLMPVPTSQSWDNSIKVNLGGLKMDVRAEVGANVAGMQATMTQSLERMFSQFTRQLQTEIRTRG